MADSGDTEVRNVDSLMMDFPLDLTMILRRNERMFPDKHIVSDTRGSTRRTTYGEWVCVVRRIGGLLDQLGIDAGRPVASFAFNSDQHLALYFGVPCAGRVLHTVNTRMSDDEIVYVIGDAEDDVVFADASLVTRVLSLIDRLPSVRVVIALNDGHDSFADGEKVLDFDSVIASVNERELTVAHERAAAAMCYTSGTTGNPKGVVYSHRSIVVHTFGIMAVNGLGICEADVVLPIVPMFHAAAWGLPFAAVAAGSKLVMPGADLGAQHLLNVIERERVTFAAGVPTVFANLVESATGRDLTSLRAVMSGGSAVPKALSQRFRDTTGLPLLHAWGMTEASPMGAICHVRSDLSVTTDDQLDELRTSVGMPLFGVEMRIMDDTASEMAWNGVDAGELQIRGPWIADGYHGVERSPAAFTDDGWFRTGDVATIDPFGYVRLVDRTKDLVKSGGEWISSVRLENEIMAHPAVHQAAVIAVPHETWQERPMACVVLRAGESLTSDELTEFLAARVPKWWIPDSVEFLDELPLTATGKFSKRTLRDRHAAGQP